MDLTLRFGLVLVSCLLLGGCGSGGDQAAEPSDQVSSVPQVPTEVEEPTLACVYDYQPMKGPKEMAGESDLVLRGTIGEPRPGLTVFRSDGTPGRVETEIIPIDVSTILKNGERLSEMEGGEPEPARVEVEISCPFRSPNEDAKRASLAGREVVAYLVEGRPIPGQRRVRYAAGAPDPKFQEASVEGFLIELASGNGTRNLSLAEQFPGADLTDFYPDKPRFPQQREP